VHAAGRTLSGKWYKHMDSVGKISVMKAFQAGAKGIVVSREYEEIARGESQERPAAQSAN
jgi:hypothetical protein